jgi:hypothetical protein
MDESIPLRIVSDVDGGLIGVIVRGIGAAAIVGRQDISDPDELLQVATISTDGDVAYPAHEHKPKYVRQAGPTQEVWIVVVGTVLVTFYDVNQNPLGTHNLAPGDCAITYRGGHDYHASPNALVYEVKTGPYHGREADKVLI